MTKSQITSTKLQLNSKLQASKDKYHAKGPDSGIYASLRQARISSYNIQQAAQAPALRVIKTGLKNERPTSNVQRRIMVRLRRFNFIKKRSQATPTFDVRC
jgi:hypothetical protein